MTLLTCDRCRTVILKYFLLVCKPKPEIDIGYKSQPKYHIGNGQAAALLYHKTDASDRSISWGMYKIIFGWCRQTADSGITVYICHAHLKGEWRLVLDCKLPFSIGRYVDFTLCHAGNCSPVAIGFIRSRTALVGNVPLLQIKQTFNIIRSAVPCHTKY